MSMAGIRTNWHPHSCCAPPHVTQATSSRTVPCPLHVAMNNLVAPRRTHALRRVLHLRGECGHVRVLRVLV